MSIVLTRWDQERSSFTVDEFRFFKHFSEKQPWPTEYFVSCWYLFIYLLTQAMAKTEVNYLQLKFANQRKLNSVNEKSTFC